MRKAVIIIFLFLCISESWSFHPSRNWDTKSQVTNVFCFVPAKTKKVNGWAFGNYESFLLCDSVYYPEQINGLYTEISLVSLGGGAIGLTLGTLMSPYFMFKFIFLDSLEVKSKFSLNKKQINGLVINGFTPEKFNVNGLCINLYGNGFDRINGFTFNILASVNQELNGLAYSTIINQISYMNGVSLAVFINKSYSAKGLQIALYNKAENMKGVQIGLWNVISGRGLPFINLSF